MSLKTNLAVISLQMTTAKDLMCLRCGWAPTASADWVILLSYFDVFQSKPCWKLRLWINVPLFYNSKFTELYNEISSSEGLCSGRNLFFLWLNTGLLWKFSLKCKKGEKKRVMKRAKRMAGPSEHNRVYKPVTGTKTRKGFGCEPRPVHHGPEWVLWVGEVPTFSPSHLIS